MIFFFVFKKKSAVTIINGCSLTMKKTKTKKRYSTVEFIPSGVYTNTTKFSKNNESGDLHNCGNTTRGNYTTPNNLSNKGTRLFHITSHFLTFLPLTAVHCFHCTPTLLLQRAPIHSTNGQHFILWSRGQSVCKGLLTNVFPSVDNKDSLHVTLTPSCGTTSFLQKCKYLFLSCLVKKHSLVSTPFPQLFFLKNVCPVKVRSSFIVQQKKQKKTTKKRVYRPYRGR